MVKCPRGTPSQIKANLANLKIPEKPSFEANLSTNDNDENEKQLDSSEEFELDIYKGDRKGSSAQDELINFFVDQMLNILLKSWDGKPCYRSKLKQPMDLTPSQSEEYGESVILPCEYISTTTVTSDYVQNLYKKRSSTLERQDEVKKISSESEELEEHGEENYEQVESKDTWKIEANEEVYMEFINGAWYKGRVWRKLMDGEGYYFWEDGTSYKGDFIDGWATGKGRIEFPCQSVYEGGVYKGFRHGEGMHCLYESPVMYTGQWWLGQKHGEGMIVYNEPSKGHNFYRGTWQDGVKEGFGFRQYASGAKYIGFWSNGKRHGIGIMLWSNNDIYRGNWKEGIMHGYGEYTWNGFINKTLSYPATNTYRGYWSEGVIMHEFEAGINWNLTWILKRFPHFDYRGAYSKRNGRGTFETINDGIINTIWENDMKSGPGTVICENGTIITGERLFYRDRQAPYNVDDDAPGLLLIDKIRRGKISIDFDPNDKNVVKAKPISIPIHSSICSINLNHHIRKYIRKSEKVFERDHKPRPLLPLKNLEKSIESLFNELDEESLEKKIDYSERAAEEEKYLRQAIASKLRKLKAVYKAYASLACDKPPPFKCLLLRLFFWQMLIDCKIPDSNRSLIDIDKLLAREGFLLIRHAHDPFEPIRLGQFILILLTLSWDLYARHVFSKNPLIHEERVAKFLQTHLKSDYKYILKIAFDYFVENDLLTGCMNSDLMKNGEKAFSENDLAPMEAMYAVYREFGEPHSIRTFLKKMMSPKESKKGDGIKRSSQMICYENVPRDMINENKDLTATGESAYIPEWKPFNIQEIINADSNLSDSQCRLELMLPNDLSVRMIMNCLAQSCYGIYSEDFLVNMDHELTFLEFYNAVIFCTELSLKVNKMKAIKRDLIEEHKRKMEEYEKLVSQQEKAKENRSLSNRRSRQVLDASKTGKK